MCNNSLFSFMNEQKELLLQNGQFKTAVSYSCTLNSFFNFRRGKDLGIEEVTSELIQSYQSWLKQRGVVANTSSFYMRVLRAVYNKAVKKNLTVQQRPFEEVYTGIDKTQKRALTIACRGTKTLSVFVALIIFIALSGIGIFSLCVFFPLPLITSFFIFRLACCTHSAIGSEAR